MSEQLQGRALDEAVARAMGWTEICREIIRLFMGRDDREFLVGNPPDGSSPAPLIRHIPAYHDDPNMQAEMLEWLRGRDGYGWMLIDIDGHKGFYAYWCGKGDDRESGFGDSINEALARLVLAVAGRDAK